MTCKTCAIQASAAHSGRYDMTCLACCTRLVMSTHPDKRQASIMLAAVERQSGNPGRDAVLACVRLAMAKRR